MGAIVKEVYDAFRSAGVSDALATAAAQAIPVGEELATKSDLRELRAETSRDLKALEIRMTVKFFAAVAMTVTGIKALDFLIG